MTLVTALRQLSPRGRAVIVLRYFEDHSVESAAALMGVSPAAVKSLGTRALAQLREQLGTDHERLLQA
jgi:RNA polymerase sigma factor (sigma-70 family)